MDRIRTIGVLSMFMSCLGFSAEMCLTEASRGWVKGGVWSEIRVGRECHLVVLL